MRSSDPLTGGILHGGVSMMSNIKGKLEEIGLFPLDRAFKIIVMPPRRVSVLSPNWSVRILIEGKAEKAFVFSSESLAREANKQIREFFKEDSLTRTK